MKKNFLSTTLLALMMLPAISVADTLCLKSQSALASLDVRQATTYPSDTVSLVGAIYARNFRTAQPTIGAGVRRGDFWIFNVDGLPNMKLDLDFNPLVPANWARVPCE